MRTRKINIQSKRNSQTKNVTYTDTDTYTEQEKYIYLAIKKKEGGTREGI